ncbi:MAG: hypothetical protein HN904_05785 [Victivallales bacterium]|nr:hypothetical protein [Victivallales bacterium]
MMKPDHNLAKALAGRARICPASPPRCRVRLTDLDVLVPLYGQSRARAQATVRAFARWHGHQVEMPRVLCAWCYREGHEPADLAALPDYDWLERVRLPEYDLDDGLFRKEGLLNLLVAEHATAPSVLASDSDCWSADPHWFRKVRDRLAENARHVMQPFRVMTDTEESLPLASWSSQTLPGLCRATALQPGLGWAFTRAWADLHGEQPVFNPWPVTGSGDCMFILEHFSDDRGKVFAERHSQYRYFGDFMRPGLPEGKLTCIPVDVRHENHTDRSAVPEQWRRKRYCDRAYHWSRVVLDLLGDLRGHVFLDAHGVPMPIDPDGVFVRVLRRKPEMQDQASTEAIVAEEVSR